MLHFVVLDILTLMTHGITLHSANAVFYNNSHARQGSCRVRTVREAVNERWSGDSMTESFVLDDVEYKLCRYRVTWDEARVFCSTHKSHLATLDDEEKVSFVVQAIAASGSVSEGYWIGARKYYGDFWMWDSNSKGLGSTISILDNTPISYPDREINDVHCLTIDRAGHVIPIFVPITCDQRRGFVCQRDSDRTFDNKIRMVAASQIGEAEFRLYSGRTTWAEAVVQCREEGLQIAEVNTAEEARVLAVSMLRNRPGIESAWIGGYTRKNESGTWRWLASGKNIKNNEMRQRNFSESMGSCLLLDRHLCEIPVYVEAKCDRKRDVLCQKPPKKRPSKKPVAVVVDGCPYWIGFYPLEWSEARRSCESTNASLVVLDSPQTISHMMSLMLDSRAELRHIWTDGHRVDGQWEWNVNGEALSPFGKSFMPWCAEDDIYVGEFNCLNLDRENLKTPLVYGLSCNQKQSYVCQPHVGACVSRAISPSTGKFGFESSEETTTRGFEVVPLVRKNWHTRSGVTGTMPMTIDDYGTQTTVEPVRYLMDDSNDRELDVTSFTKSSTGNFSTHTTTGSRFALPTFPIFGIGVASALETTTRFIASPETARNKKIKQLFVTSSPSDGSSASLITKNPIATRKPSRIDGKKAHRSTVVDWNFTGRVGSTTSVTLGSRRTSRIVDPNVHSKPRTKIAKTSTLLTPEYSSIEHRRTRKYTQTSPGRTGTKVTKMLTAFTKTSNANDEKSLGTNKPSFRRAGSLRKITTPLAKGQKKIHLFATEATTPYDAVDEDYYENYETSQTPDNHEEAVTDDAYEEEYKAPKYYRLEKKTKSGITKDTENGASRSSISSIAHELSKNMQIALMNMLKSGIDDKKPQPGEENAQSTSLSADDILEPTEHTIERRLRMKNNTKNLSLRPYYAFEGPMIVGLSGDSSYLENSDKIEPAARGHSFKLIDKTIPDVTSRNDPPEAPRHRDYRRNNAQKFSHEGNNVPIVISPLPSTAPKDASSLVQIERYLKNKFQREPESPEDRVEKNVYDERKENPRWPDGRYRPKSRENANYYETDRRLYPRGNSYVATSPFPSQLSKANVKPWQEIFKISWPEDNSTSSKIVNLDEAAFENNFSTPVRTSRSSKEDEQFPDLKIPKLIKKIKIDFDQRLLRNYLVAVVKKVTRPNDFPLEEDDWKDSWKFLLGQVSRILDRMNFNVNGELVKVKIVGDDETNDSEVNTGQIPARSSETRNNLTYPLESREIYDSESPMDITETTDSSELHSDENSMEGSSQEKSGSERISQEGDYEPDKFLSNATRRAGNPPRYDEKSSTDTRKDVSQGYPPTLRPAVNRNVPRWNGNKLTNWYATKYANSNISRIFVAPAIVRPVGISRIYSFQPIMPQLHHRLAFNQVFAKSRVDQRLKNSSMFRNAEDLPRGTLSRIVGVKYPKRRFPEKIIAKTNFWPFRNSSNEAIKSRHRETSNGSVGNSEKAKNQSGSVGNPEKARKQDGEEVNNCERNKLDKRDVEGRTTSDENSVADYSESVNDRGRDQIVRYLDKLTEEPSIVSLRIMMNPREKAATRKIQQPLDSSELSDDPRTVELRLKFSGRAKKMVNYLRLQFSNDSRGSLLNRTSNGGTRNISPRISDKNRRRPMIHKLQEMSRMIVMKNDPPPWKTKSASRRDRNFRTWRTSESEELAVDERRQAAPSLSNLRENNDQLTLYFDLKLGRVVTKPTKTVRKSRT